MAKKLDLSKLDIQVVEMGNLPLIIFRGKLGYIATAHVDIKTAEKLGDVAAITPSVRNVEEFVNAKLRAVTSWAEDLGLREGMTVKRAIKVLNGEEKIY